MSFSIYGKRHLDEGRFKMMMDAKIACEKAGISYPKEVIVYFNDIPGESEEYLRNELEDISLDGLYTEGNAGCESYELSIEMSDIPSDVKTLKFSIS